MFEKRHRLFRPCGVDSACAVKLRFCGEENRPKPATMGEMLLSCEPSKKIWGPDVVLLDGTGKVEDDESSVVFCDVGGDKIGAVDVNLERSSRR